ncbi:acyl carrier protein [Faunimonas pinastri]|uniref:Acyl carrier protein n=1 Tax=Faunimonas pinastri TaxID=1855383 RepID=A0A1H9FH28_9HYPH|nr:acyl carrier protein [Faunimonas pinastri]SEQ37224.1 acyl carrier protein [Faunimonas pinastri]
MNRDQIRSKIAELLGDITDNDDLALTDETTADDVDGWDSVNHVKLIVALESALKIRFDSDEITAPDNVGALVDLIAEKLPSA